MLNGGRSERIGRNGRIVGEEGTAENPLDIRFELDMDMRFIDRDVVDAVSVKYSTAKLTRD